MKKNLETFHVKQTFMMEKMLVSESKDIIQIGNWLPEA